MPAFIDDLTWLALAVACWLAVLALARGCARLENPRSRP